MTRRTAGIVFAAVLLCYLPHVLWATWVYEDVAVLSTTAADVPYLSQRGLLAAFWQVQWALVPTPRIFHAVSFGLHLLVAGMTAVFVRRLGVSARGALCAAVAVSIPALSVEAVAYAAQQGELLATVAVLGACILAAGQWWSAPAWVGMLTLIALGMWAQESTIAALWLVPLVIWASPFRTWRARPLWAVTWFPAVIAAELAYGGVLFYGGLGTLANLGEIPGATVSAGDWFLLQSTALARSIGLLILPIGSFTVDYDYDAVSQAVRWMSVIGLASIAVLAWRLRQRWPLMTLGLTWLLVAVLPRLVVQTPRSYLNEGQAYLLLPGLGIVAAALYDKVYARQSDGIRWTVAASDIESFRWQQQP